MKVAWFNAWENIDWARWWSVVGTLTAFWAALTALTIVWPPFDTPFKVINIILGAVTWGLLFAARSSKYVADRTQVPPADGKP